MVDSSECGGSDGKVLQCVDGSEFVRTHDKVNVLLGQLHKWFSMFRKVSDEDTHDSDGTQETPDVGHVLGYGPIANLLDSVIVGFSTLVSAHVSDNGCALNTNT